MDNDTFEGAHVGVRMQCSGNRSVPHHICQACLHLCLLMPSSSDSPWQQGRWMTQASTRHWGIEAHPAKEAGRISCRGSEQWESLGLLRPFRPC
jgi:hypothetical protein